MYFIKIKSYLQIHSSLYPFGLNAGSLLTEHFNPLLKQSPEHEILPFLSTVFLHEAQPQSASAFGIGTRLIHFIKSVFLQIPAHFLIVEL